jgi:imidazolonepropionase-like amidohydrolase
LLTNSGKLDTKTKMKSIKAEILYTGKSIISNAYLSFEGPLVKEVSSSPHGEVVGKYPVVTPAFIDAHSHIGMARAGEPQAENEANEHADSMFFLADALDSVQFDDRCLQDAVEMGVLYSCVLPGSGNIIGGLSAVIRNYAKSGMDALVARAGVKSAFGYNPMSTTAWKGTRPTTRMGAFAMLRTKFDEALQKIERFNRLKGEKKDEITFSAEEKILFQVLDKRLRLRAHVHKIDDIASLLRLVDEFDLDICVEHAMDVHSPEIFTELEKRNFPVIYGPMDSFAYKVELKHETWRNIKHLINSGVRFGLMTDHPVTPAHQLFYHTRWFLREGLSKQNAIELISRKNAEILGIDAFLGVLEKGKWASFVCWNKDPFDLTGYPAAVYAEGQIRYLE